MRNGRALFLVVAVLPRFIRNDVDDIHDHHNHQDHGAGCAGLWEHDQNIGKAKRNTVCQLPDAIFLLPERPIFRVTVILVEWEVNERILAHQVAHASNKLQYREYDCKKNRTCHRKCTSFSIRITHGHGKNKDGIQLYKREGPARKQRPHNKKPAGSRRLQALVRLDTYFFGVISLFSLGSLIFGVCVS